MVSLNQPAMSPDLFKGFWIRLVASLIDGIILMCFVLGFSFFFFIIFSSTFDNDAGLLAIALAFILALIFTLFYKPLMETSEYQGTFGKYFLGMKIVNQDGQKINSGTSLIRTLVFLAQFMIPWLNLITVWLFLLIGYMDYKQGLHDMAAKTYVVSKYWQGPITVEDVVSSYDDFGA